MMLRILNVLNLLFVLVINCNNCWHFANHNQDKYHANVSWFLTTGTDFVSPGELDLTYSVKEFLFDRLS